MNTSYDASITFPKAQKLLWLWQTLPCTLSIIFTPFVALIYSLTQSENARDGSFSIAQVIHGVLCMIMLFSLLITRQLYLLKQRIIRPLIFLAVYALLTCLLGPFPYENAVYAVKLLFVSIVFISAFNLSKHNLCSERWLINCTWVIVILMAMSQIIGLVAGNNISIYESNFATGGVIEKASVTAAIIVSCMPVFFTYFPHRTWAFIGTLIACISVFFTMRRTELIAAAGSTILILFYNLNPFRIKIPWPKMFSILLILGLIIIFALNTQAGEDFLTRLTELNPSKGTGSGRYIFWRICYDHILNRSFDAKIIGEGMGSIRDIMYQNYGIYIGSHTDWLDLTHAFGIFGLFGLLWWCFELIHFAGFLRRYGHYAFQGVFSIIVIFFFISIGQGGIISNPAFVLIYAALGFWTGQVPDYIRTLNYAGSTSSYQSMKFKDFPRSN